MNPAIEEIMRIQREMAGEGTVLSEDDVMELVKDVRPEAVQRNTIKSPRSAADMPSYRARPRIP